LAPPGTADYYYSTHRKAGRKRKEAARCDEVKVRLYGDVGVATSHVTIEGKYSGRESSGQYRSLHAWVRRPAGWELVANQITAVAR